MKNDRVFRISVFLLLAAASCFAQDASKKIASEINRVKNQIGAGPANFEQWTKLKPGVDAGFVRAEENLKAGRAYRSLEELVYAAQVALGAKYAAQDPELLKKGLAGFEPEFNKAMAKYTALDNQAQARAWGDAPVAIRALSESADQLGIEVVEASRAYEASLDDPTFGYFYIGEAEGFTDFSRFLFDAKFHRKGAAFPLRSYRPEIQRLQDRINAAFVPPASVDHHDEFIQINSSLKVAGEMDARRYYAGALYQYLRALQLFADVSTTVPSEAERGELQKKAEAIRQQLKHSKLDESVAEMFLERAEGITATYSGQPAPGDEAWRNHKAIVEQVMPAYYEARDSHPELQNPATKILTVTVVRWPYT